MSKNPSINTIESLNEMISLARSLLKENWNYHHFNRSPSNNSTGSVSSTATTTTNNNNSESGNSNSKSKNRSRETTRRMKGREEEVIRLEIARIWRYLLAIWIAISGNFFKMISGKFWSRLFYTIVGELFLFLFPLLSSPFNLFAIFYFLISLSLSQLVLITSRTSCWKSIAKRIYCFG